MQKHVPAHMNKQYKTYYNMHSNLTYNCVFHLLSFQQFQAHLTFFSKSFSHFPHGTCLLSVSSLYLDSDELYHPLCAPLPRNATLGNTPCTKIANDKQEFHLHCCFPPKSLHLHFCWLCFWKIQFKAVCSNFQHELILVHSPLLKESYLVCVPLLT